MSAVRFAYPLAAPMLTGLRDRRIEVLCLVSLGFAAWVSDTPLDFACLLAAAAVGWGLIQANLAGARRPLLGAASIVLAFVALRQAPLMLAHPPIGRTIGLSYMMFRIIHMIVDAASNELPGRPRVRDYTCYLFCGLTFLAGPIQRFPDFIAQISRPAVVTRQAAGEALALLLRGAFRFTVAAGVCFGLFGWARVPHPGIPVAALHTASWIGFAGYLYQSFAGYTDMMRALGRLIGLDLPENFERPFAAANFLDIWGRWHISLSDWFKLYLFNPLVKALIARGRPAMIPYYGAIGFFVTFFAMGLWHGISLRFALYGMCLGAGASANKLYQSAMQRRMGKAGFSRLSRDPVYQAAASALAVTFFILALGFLWIDVPPTAPTVGSWAKASILVLAAVLLFGVLSRAATAVWPTRPAHAAGRATVVLLQVGMLSCYLLWLPVPPLLYAFF